MIACLVAALVIGAAASAASGAPPLREVVYKFSDNETSNFTTDQAGTGYTTTQGTNGLAAPPQSSTRSAGFSGTMTIDVLQVDADGFLKADVKEATNAENGRAPFDAVFIVRPDGQLAKASGTDDGDMTSLMQYFGTKYFGDRSFDQGTQWITSSTLDKVQYNTTTTITDVNGSNVTLKMMTKASRGVMNGSYSIETSLVYNAPKLVPVTLDVLSIRMGSGDTASAEQQSHYHFDRISDTADPTH